MNYTKNAITVTGVLALGISIEGNAPEIGRQPFGFFSRLGVSELKIMFEGVYLEIEDNEDGKERETDVHVRNCSASTCSG